MYDVWWTVHVHIYVQMYIPCHMWLPKQGHKENRACAWPSPEAAYPWNSAVTPHCEEAETDPRSVTTWRGWQGEEAMSAADSQQSLPHVHEWASSWLQPQPLPPLTETSDRCGGADRPALPTGTTRGKSGYWCWSGYVLWWFVMQHSNCNMSHFHALLVCHLRELCTPPDTGFA